MVRENTRISNPQVPHTLDPQPRAQSVADSARADRVVLGHDKVPDSGFGLLSIREIELGVLWESALCDFAFHGFGIGDLGEHLDASGEDSGVGWVAQEARVDFWVVGDVWSLYVH